MSGNQIINIPSYIQIVYDPNLTFENLQRNPRWFSCFAVYSVSLMVIAYFFQPIIVNSILSNQFISEVDTENLEKAFNIIKKTNLFSIFAIPLFEFFRVLFFSLLVTGFYLMIEIKEIPFPLALSAICHSRIILGLESIYNLCLVLIHGQENVHGFEDVNLTGLNIFFKIQEVGFTKYMLLNELSIFSVWYVIILFIAFKKLFNFSKITAISLSVLFWTIGVGIKLGFLQLFTKTGMIP